MNLEEIVISKALKYGFGTAGIATVSTSISIERYKLWLQQNKHGTMSYLERNIEMRADPRNLLPEAKSIVVVAMQCPVNHYPDSGIAMYARFMDYHIVMRRRLRTLIRDIESILSRKIHAQICVDSAPLLEREWAVRAGIGWIGKQGQVVNERLGACILLGAALFDIELTPTISSIPEKLNDHCGDCNKCVNACPAGAIEADRTIDARKCIAYLTVEHKGQIPDALSDKMGRRIFGCDSCTSVCPWNNKADEKLIQEFRKPLLPDLELQQILKISEDEFREKFKDTVLIRTGLERLRRNLEKVGISQ